MANMPSMKKKYVEEVAPALMTKFQYESVMQIPKIEKLSLIHISEPTRRS